MASVYLRQHPLENKAPLSVFSSAIVVVFSPSVSSPKNLKSNVSSNFRLLQMRSFSTRTNSLTEGDDAGDGVVVREIVGESCYSHFGQRPPMVSVVEYT